MNAGPTDEIVFSHLSHQVCAEHALVLRSAGIPSSIQGRPGDYVLLVAPHHAVAARQELDAYHLENPAPRTHDDGVYYQASGWHGVLAYAMVILLVAICRDRGVFGLDWFNTGKTSAGLIRDGQWWRAITALTLHADRSHLIANLLVGGLFGLFAAQLLGSGLAWLSILVAGGAGNLVNAYSRPETHTSVGASTAVFAALGICAAFAFIRRRALPQPAFARFAPLIGGLVLLGYLGAEGARTDVAAHVAGFVCGILLGAIYGHFRTMVPSSRRAQIACAAAALMLLAAAWAWGLAATP